MGYTVNHRRKYILSTMVRVTWDEEFRRRVRVRAAEENVSIGEVVTRAMASYLGTAAKTVTPASETGRAFVRRRRTPEVFPPVSPEMAPVQAQVCPVCCHLVRLHRPCGGGSKNVRCESAGCACRVSGESLGLSLE